MYSSLFVMTIVGLPSHKRYFFSSRGQNPPSLNFAFLSDFDDTCVRPVTASPKKKGEDTTSALL
jgi:hypothetical protein